MLRTGLWTFTNKENTYYNSNYKNFNQKKFLTGYKLKLFNAVLNAAIYKIDENKLLPLLEILENGQNLYKKKFVSVMEYAEYILDEGKRFWFENNKKFEKNIVEKADGIAESLSDDDVTRGLIVEGIYSFERFSRVYKNVVDGRWS